MLPLVLAAAVSAQPAHPLTAKQKREIFLTVWNGITQNFYDPDISRLALGKAEARI